MSYAFVSCMKFDMFIEIANTNKIINAFNKSITRNILFANLNLKVLAFEVAFLCPKNESFHNTITLRIDNI